MRVQGNVIPAAIHMEPYAREPGKTEIRLRENVKPVTKTDGITGQEYTLYEYDEYVMQMTDRPSLRSDIEAKVDDYMATGRALEAPENASIVADLRTAYTTLGGTAHTEQAPELRGFIEQAVQSLPDADALQAKTLYPSWAPDTCYDKDYRVLYNSDLYRVVQAHTAQCQYPPGIDTAALYTRIDETHAGTIDDPIPYGGNMALEQGKYYSQGGVTYLCTRDTGIPVYNALADLVGLYVEAAA